MFEWLHRSILYPAQGCKFINNMESVIHHSINCPFHLLYCALCKSLCNVSVLTHDCNVIISQPETQPGSCYWGAKWKFLLVGGASLKVFKIFNIGLRNFYVMFKGNSDKNNQLKLNKIIFLSIEYYCQFYTCVINAWSFKYCTDKFLLLIIAGMNTSKLNLNFDCKKPIYLVEFIYIYIYYNLHKLVCLKNNNLCFE